MKKFYFWVKYIVFIKNETEFSDIFVSVDDHLILRGGGGAGTFWK